MGINALNTVQKSCGSCGHSWHNDHRVMVRLGCRAPESEHPFWSLLDTSYHPRNPFTFLMPADGTHCAAWKSAE